MDEPGTIFCLIPEDVFADEIVCDNANHKRKRVDPNNLSKPFLRIGINQPSVFPGNLVRFGKFPHGNDVILGEGWSKDDQCYFDFHPTTQELLLHDISSRSNTKLWDDKITDLLGKSPRICIVPLTREWNFTIGCANFRLVPSKFQSKDEIDEFSRLLVPENYERTLEDPLERLLRKTALQPAPSKSSHNTRDTRVVTRRLPKRGEDIKWVHVKPLGTGGQGEVYEVVDVNTGEHYACKVLKFHGLIQEWNISSEPELKNRIRYEVEIVEKSTPCWEAGQSAQIFMPIYEWNLQTLLERVRLQGKEVVRAIAERMLYQVLLVLDHVHASRIIHRDIKPENILCQDDEFFLTDFGITKSIDTSKTMAGTQWYMAPELWLNRSQTLKVDIYSLGVTYLECLQPFGDVNVRRATYPHWQQWQLYLRTLARKHDYRVEPMLANFADQRPTARELLIAFSPPAHALPSPRNSIKPLSFGAPLPPTSQVSGTTTVYSKAPSSNMDWTRTGATAFSQGNPKLTRDKFTQLPQPNLTAAQSPKVPLNQPAQLRSGPKGSVKSTRSRDKRNQRGHKRDGLAQNMRRTPSQSMATPEPTSSRRQRSRSQRSRLQRSRLTRSRSNNRFGA